MQSVTSHLVGVIRVDEEGVEFERLQAVRDQRFTITSSSRETLQRRMGPIPAAHRVVRANTRQLHRDLNLLFSSIMK